MVKDGKDGAKAVKSEKEIRSSPDRNNRPQHPAKARPFNKDRHFDKKRHHDKIRQERLRGAAVRANRRRAGERRRPTPRPAGWAASTPWQRR